jgi:acyl-coenzyme A synthetase/AMP-(fatty) acid ligase
MPLNSIREHLARLPGERILIQSNRGTIGASDLLTQWPEPYSARVRGRNVVLAVQSLPLAAHALVALDDNAAVVFIANPLSSPELIASLAMQIHCDVLVSDLPNLISQLGTKFETLSIPPSGLPSKIPSSSPIRTAWVLSTSGTTGTPKPVCHSVASLTHTSKIDFQRGTSSRWGLLYDYTRFAGLQVVLQSLLSGSLLIAPDLMLPLDDQLAFLAEHDCTHLSGTPTLWRKIILSRYSNRLPLRQITLGGEIADARILTTLRRLFPSSRITHIYASTEAGVVFSISDGREGFPAAFLTAPPPGVAICIRDERLFVRTAQTETRYLGTDTPFTTADGFIDTGDTVTLRDDRFVFLGRADGVINVGGNKCHPEEIERVLLGCRGVLTARVLARKSPITGALVAAEIVPAADEPDLDQLRGRILSHCRIIMEPYKVPVDIRFVPEILMADSGKMTRI